MGEVTETHAIGQVKYSGQQYQRGNKILAFKRLALFGRVLALFTCRLFCFSAIEIFPQGRNCWKPESENICSGFSDSE